MRRNATFALLLVLWAVPAVAQQSGRVEIGLVGKWTHLDNSFSEPGKSTTAWGASIRLGLFLNRHWEVEADDAQNFGHATGFFKGFSRTTLNYYPHHLRVNFNQNLRPSGRLTWLLGLGAAYNGYGAKPTATEPGFKGHDWGIAGMTGVRGRLTSALGVRVDASLDYIPSPNNGKAAIVSQFQGINAATPPDKNVDLGVQAGFYVMLGRTK